MPFILPIIIVALVGLTLPPAVDAMIGDGTYPEDQLYGVERLGESIRIAFGVLDHKDSAQERIREAERLAENGNRDRAREILDDAQRDAQQVAVDEDRELLENKITWTRDMINTGALR